MTKKITLCVLLLVLCFGTRSVFAQAVFSLSVLPAEIIQGDPFLVQIEGTNEISSIKKITFAGKKVGIFMYQGKPSLLIGIDLNKKPGAYELIAEFSDGNIIKKVVNIGAREKIETPLGIPEKLGGNTKASQDKLVASLVAEKKSITGIRTSAKALWSDPFIPPLKEIFITDPYGPSRITGVYSIPHKGVDYRAIEGTAVMAVNRGIVRIVKSYRDYGKTIVVDHGLGLMTFYLHLSKFKVKEGAIVERGQVIGLSGQTGYTLGAHLHLGVRINDIAIDPVKFFELFQ
jgi:murein DD-endopeptidase MepM/ murein hydrolase activator NlpD